MSLLSETPEIFIRPATNADCGRVQNLVLKVLDEYGLGFEPEGMDVDITDIEKYFIDAGGVFELLENAKGSLLGTVGLFPVDGDIIELRKMYFDKSLRGLGIGRKILHRMIEKAGQLGFKKIYLETNTTLREAVSLYENFGFQPTAINHTSCCDAAYIRNI